MVIKFLKDFKGKVIALIEIALTVLIIYSIPLDKRVKYHRLPKRLKK